MEQAAALKGMRESMLGRMVYTTYPSMLRWRPVLWRVARSEGWFFTSLTLRRYLKAYWGVEAGDYSYGSLLFPGRAEPGTVIGRYCSIGPDCWAFRKTHPVSAISLHPYWFDRRHRPDLTDAVATSRPLEVGHDCWIGANVIILPSASRIGIGSIVGAGSVVTRDIPDFSVAVGNPARVIRQRISDEAMARLYELEPWQYEPVEAQRRYAQAAEFNV